MRLDPADVLFSKYIRTRDGWRCVRCGGQYTPPTNGLHNSHFFGRGRENTRFDPDNCDALCFGCHKIWGSDDKEGYRNFKIKQLGRKRYRELEIRSEIYSKKDRKLEYIYVKSLYEKLTETQ